jgi:hypothetical protein
MGVQRPTSRSGIFRRLDAVDALTRLRALQNGGIRQGEGRMILALSSSEKSSATNPAPALLRATYR